MENFALCVGIGFLAFWVWVWLTGEMTTRPEPWPGHHRHEFAFAVPDCVLGAALIVSALVTAPWTRDLQLVCAGALTFFALMDLSYLKITWASRTAAMRARTAGLALIALACSVSILLERFG